MNENIDKMDILTRLAIVQTGLRFSKEPYDTIEDARTEIRQLREQLKEAKDWAEQIKLDIQELYEGEEYQEGEKP